MYKMFKISNQLIIGGAVVNRQIGTFRWGYILHLREHEVVAARAVKNRGFKLSGQATHFISKVEHIPPNGLTFNLDSNSDYRDLDEATFCVYERMLSEN